MQPRATRLSSYQFNVSAAVYDDYAKSSRNRRFRLWSIDRQIFRTNEVGVVAPFPRREPPRRASPANLLLTKFSCVLAISAFRGNVENPIRLCAQGGGFLF
jgi:hypothetical protein